MKHTTSMDIKKFSFNKNANYRAGLCGLSTEGIGNTLTKPFIYIQSERYFRVQYPNVFEGYKLPGVEILDDWQNWKTHQLQFPQNQINFAVWCSTTGCGVSKAHIFLSQPFLGGLYRFHVYYTIRRILAEMGSPTPQDSSWNVLDNPYNRKAYERICNEFGCDFNTDWRIKGPNFGAGRAYFNWGGKEYVQDPSHDGAFDSSYMSFEDEPDKVKIRLKQDDPDTDYRRHASIREQQS